MKKLLLTALALLQMGLAQPAGTQWLVTFQLAPGVDLRSLTPQQKAVFTEHARQLGTLRAKGLVAGGRTNEPVNTMAVLILACDEATARAVAAEDPAARAGLLQAAVRPFSMVLAPAPPAVLVSDTRANYETVAQFLIEGARLMPDEDYAFRPTPEVRTFGQLAGHIAEAQYIACSLVRGEEYRPRHIEETLSKKPELVGALEAAVGYCRESWSTLAPEALADPVTLFGGRRTKLGAMDLATAHAFEHYGNMVTYLRMKGLVPPGSAR